MNNGKKKGRSLAAPAFLLPYAPKCVEEVFSQVHGSKRPVERGGKHTRAAFGNPFGVETRGSSTFCCSFM
jgi:hypothetical protein